jgi:hypothetical protein
MSTSLATVADALIEFILSLLQDPEEAKKFDAAPQAVMASKGLSQVRAEDVCSVAPVVAERPDIIQIVRPVHVQPANDRDESSVIREVRSIVNNLSWVDDRDTVVDQSVNQNIWAEGDVTQTFDQETNVASGDGAIAAGENVDIDQTEDNSTTITAGEDANVGNETTTETVEGSGNTTTDASTTTEAPVTTTTTDSNNDNSTTETADESYNSSAVEYTETAAESDTDVISDSSESTIVEGTGADDGL